MPLCWTSRFSNAARSMTYPRKTLICLQDTPYYHVVARCVRRAWLWGVDEYAGKDYSHRKVWVLERLDRLSSVFAIDVCAYAIMSNHYHLVVHVDTRQARRWTAQETVERWAQVFGLPVVIKRWQQGECSEAEREMAQGLIERWRRRLCDVSWYMRCLNEHLARQANAEDGCTGRFWKGRFKSQALLDEAGLLTAMAYVDLNPVRAGMANTPETSEFTSIQSRLHTIAHTKAAMTTRATDLARISQPAPRLLDFREAISTRQLTIPYSLPDYLELVDWTGRAIRAGKRGAINSRLPSILQRLSIDGENWVAMMEPRGNMFGRALGQVDRLRRHAEALGQSWVRGLRRAELLYRPPSA